MFKLLGNVLVLLLLYLALLSLWTPGDGLLAKHQALAERIGQFGILSLAAGTLIITGGIDLSMGSAIALFEVALAKLMIDWQCPPALAIPLVLLLGAAIGLGHGLLVAGLRIPAFVVTLCGLFLYRSGARWIAEDQTKGLSTQYEGLKEFFIGSIFGVPVHFCIFLVLLLLLGVFLHLSVSGRYFFAIGSNEKAASYCGIATARYKMLAYILCSTLTALFAVLNLLKMNSVQPSSTGNGWELNGIAAAVIGGCSLRGGEGNVLGIFLGTCIIYILPTLAVYLGLPSYLEPALFGTALLLAAIADELLRRYKFRLPRFLSRPQQPVEVG
jgi:ribose transport system permease protein